MTTPPLELVKLARDYLCENEGDITGGNYLTVVGMLNEALDAWAKSAAPEPCPDGDACPDARRYGSIHAAPAVAPVLDALVRDLEYIATEPYEQIKDGSAERIKQAVTLLTAMRGEIAELEQKIGARDCELSDWHCETEGCAVNGNTTNGEAFRASFDKMRNRAEAAESALAQATAEAMELRNAFADMSAQHVGASREESDAYLDRWIANTRAAPKGE